MDITLDPMPALKTYAELRVNNYFNGKAVAESQRDAEHAAKRDAAQTVLAGGETPDWFATAAEIEDMSIGDFAAEIVAKPNEAAQRGNERRRRLVTIRGAASVDEVRACISEIQALSGSPF